MDETSGGTMTPPREQDPVSGEVAQVIRLRRHARDIDTTEPGETSETGGPDSRGIWDHDAPITGLTERPSVWEQPTASELLAPANAARDATDASGRETTIVIAARRAGFTRVARRPLAQIAAVAAVLATTAVVVALADNASHPRATHVAAAASTSVLKHRVTDAAPAKAKWSAHARRTTAKTATHSRAVARHSSKRRVPHATVTVAAHHAPAVAPASGSLSSAPSLQQTTPLQRAQAPVHSPNTLSSSGTSSCVPGELGC